MDIRVLLVKFMGKPNVNKSIGAFQLILQITSDICLYISTLNIWTKKGLQLSAIFN